MWYNNGSIKIQAKRCRIMANRINYQLEMEKVLRRLGDTKPTLLLHACCAPCSSATLERLAEHFRLSILYYNPNIYPPAEYHRREAELERFVEQAGYRYPVIELPYEPDEFYTAVKGLEQEPEKGGRCTVCYRLRLEQTARYAAAHGFEWFCTTLSISPMKDPIRINALGQELGEKYNVCFLPSEFRKKDGYKRSLQLSAEYGLYRQDYCGCVFTPRSAGRCREATEGPGPEGLSAKLTGGSSRLCGKSVYNFTPRIFRAVQPARDAGEPGVLYDILFFFVFVFCLLLPRLGRGGPLHRRDQAQVSGPRRPQWAAVHSVRHRCPPHQLCFAGPQQ